MSLSAMASSLQRYSSAISSASEISNAVYRLTVLYQKCTSFLTLKYFILSRHIYLPFTRSFYLKCYIEAKDKKYFGA